MTRQPELTGVERKALRRLDAAIAAKLEADAAVTAAKAAAKDAGLEVERQFAATELPVYRYIGGDGTVVDVAFTHQVKLKWRVVSRPQEDPHGPQT